MSSIETIQSRIPAFLWDALQDVFYEQDVAFLKTIAAHIQMPIHELKRSLLGTRGQNTTIHVGKTDAWWETKLCPLRYRDEKGVWRQCGNYREGNGFCGKHHNFWESTPFLKHKDDPWFQQVAKRVPMRYNDEIVWVSDSGDAIYENGSPVNSIKICPKSGIVTHLSEEDT